MRLIETHSNLSSLIYWPQGLFISYFSPVLTASEEMPSMFAAETQTTLTPGPATTRADSRPDRTTCRVRPELRGEISRVKQIKINPKGRVQTLMVNIIVLFLIKINKS